MPRSFTRRRFLSGSTLVLASAAVHGWRPTRLLAAAAENPEVKVAPTPALRFGLVTDIHHADKVPQGTRYYRDSLAKMQVAVQSLNDLAKQDKTGLAFSVALGDMVDSAGTTVTDENVAKELGWLKAIEAEWAKIGTERHYVLGNHCVDTLTKAEFFENTKGKPAPYAFEAAFKQGEGAVHVVILDACFKADGTPYGRKSADWRDTNLPESQVAWLEQDLAKAKNPTIVFVHQRLEGPADYCLKNAAKVREVIEKSGKALAVFQGHSHQNSLAVVNGIPYGVFRAVIEGGGAGNNAFSAIEVFPDHSIRVRGFFQQTTYEKLPEKKPA